MDHNDEKRAQCSNVVCSRRVLVRRKGEISRLTVNVEREVLLERLANYFGVLDAAL